MSNYHPEPYWSEVAERIASRADLKIIAGDDEPYYRYKRAEFLKMLDSLSFKNKSVLEVGPGPGGNLKVVKGKGPAELKGADISQDMINLATKNLNDPSIELRKSDGTNIPFEDDRFDLVYAATVLQHNTDEAMLSDLIKDMCRISRDEIHIFERIDDPIAGDELCLGRPVGYYEKFFNDNGFSLVSSKFINIHISYLICGAIRKLLNPKTRKEGEPLNGVSLLLQKLTLPVTKVLDKIFTAKRDVAHLSFKKK